VSQHQHLLDLFQLGLGTHAGSTGLLVNRIVLGLFFAISGFHKLFNKERHAQLVATLKSSHIPLIAFNQWWVPIVELSGGLTLLAGTLAPLAALALAIECFVAVSTDGWKRIAAYHPIDKADWLDDLLYLPEMLAIVALLIVVTLGPGPFTLPAFLF
jgi:putative oxidoreductase